MSALRVLTITEHYLPGYRYGGPIRTIENIAAALGDEIRMGILTRDRDLGDRAPYPGLPRDAWTPRGPVEVRYLPPAAVSLSGLRRRVNAEDFDLLYLNSLFAPLTRRLLLLRRLGRLADRPVLLAPRGELAPGALRFRRAKKLLFLRIARSVGLFRGVVWQASSALEAEEIRAAVGPEAAVGVAPDLAAATSATVGDRPPKRAGEARFVFLSRISPKKNLLGALDALEGVEGDVTLDVFGTEEDAAYARRCRERAAALAGSVRCTFHGPVPPDRVDEALGARHFLLLPTWGENFGHVILEALRVGTPVVIGDGTPWRGLEGARAGWDVPPGEETVRPVLRRCVRMDGPEYAAWSEGARSFARGAVRAGEARLLQLELFRAAAAGGAGEPIAAALRGRYVSGRA
jgi:glycosyltransferase involved in cell wall biosynthesis